MGPIPSLLPQFLLHCKVYKVIIGMYVSEYNTIASKMYKM